MVQSVYLNKNNGLKRLKNKSMDLTGKLIEKTDIQSGVSKKGNQWSKIGFSVKVEGKFPKDVYFEALNSEVIQFVSDTNLESDIRVWYDISSRKWKDRWFTSVTAYKVEVIRQDNSFVVEQNEMNQMVQEEARKREAELQNLLVGDVEDGGDDLGLPF